MSGARHLSLLFDLTAGRGSNPSPGVIFGLYSFRKKGVNWVDWDG
ncbi:MAG: hypothetical protein ACLFVX_08780 [Archaeoglobaceae archaeon]